MSEDQSEEAVIVVSHRGPIEYGIDDAGDRQGVPGGGGLVSALTGVANYLDDLRWVCAAISDEDIAVSAEHGGEAFAPSGMPASLLVRMLEIDPEAHRQFYEVIANPLLWFVQHQLWNLPYTPGITAEDRRAFEEGYRQVNAIFAAAVVDELAAEDNRAAVMIHDYHFYLLPALVRKECPDAFIHHFVHIPWPQPDAWRVLPPAMREEIFNGLLGNDVVAFHTEGFARNFCLCCQELFGHVIDLETLTVDLGDRRVRARWYPISVDAGHLDEMALSAGVIEREAEIAKMRRRHLVARVDRTDLSKNILRGFQAFDLVLDEHPELHGEVTFLAMLQPSRQAVFEYSEYLDAVMRTVADINLKHGRPDWQPIDLRIEQDLELAIAVYKQFDVLVVNAIFDGMNLVAKEAVVVNSRNGVLALSENTGAHQELGAFAVTLHPFDLQQQADAIYESLTMDDEERRSRHEACETVVRSNDIGKWIRTQLDDLKAYWIEAEAEAEAQAEPPARAEPRTG